MRNTTKKSLWIVFVLSFTFGLPVNGQTILSNDSIAEPGTVYRIDASNFPQGITISPEELIQGAIPGLQITSNSGSPGSNFTIINRGIGSLSGYTSPLIIIDGMLQFDNQIPLHPEDIASIVVVKDASALSTFGSLAANGALIITTKKGGGKLHINYSGNISISEISKKADMLSASAFRSLINQEYAGNSSITGLLGTANTDWQNEIYQPAFGQDHHLSVSGSYKWLPYRLSFGQTNQQGILKTDQNDRTVVTLSLTPTFFNNQLKVSFNSFVSLHNNIIGNTNAITSALSFDPTQPVMNGSPYGGYFINNVSIYATQNPVALLNQVHQTENTNRIEGNLGIDYSLPFIHDLHVVGNYAYDYSGMKYRETNDPDAAWYQQYAPTIKTNETDRRQQYNIHLNYTTKIEAIDARLNAIAGYSSISAKSDVDYSVNSYPANPNSVAPFYQLIKQYNHAAIMGGFDFIFKDKYSLSSNVQKYSDSQFANNTKPDITTSEILTWNIKKESFLQHTDWLSDLKLHVNYSNVGNINSLNSSNVYTASYQESSYVFGSSVLINPKPQSYNPTLKHEAVSTCSAGMGFSILNQRVTGTFDLYQRNTNNLLMLYPISMGSNTVDLYVNDGQIINKGIELQLSGKPVVTKNLTWTVNYSFSYNQNKRTGSNYSFLNLYGNIIGGTGNDILIIQNNYPVGSFYAHRQIYDSNGNPIEGMYATNSQGSYFIEHQLYPTVLMGFSSALKYKKWFFNCSLHANIGNYVYNGVDANWGYLLRTYSSYGYLSNVSQNALTTKFQNFQPLSDYYIQNASFLRMDHISVGYTFDKLFDTFMNTKLFVEVQNAFIITGYKGQDPEQATGIDQGNYPRARILSFGLSVDI
ncbi:MAG: SusC/RagA family TonB-linked outer membrane protein [Paludibacter sp.]|nr:SusC/RagA family TonB-linked outer membrane protein [Paludibacter sp.]